MEKQRTAIVNLKNYKESTGKNIENFLGSLNSVHTDEKVRIIMAINPIDLKSARKYSKF